MKKGVNAWIYLSDFKIDKILSVSAAREIGFIGVERARATFEITIGIENVWNRFLYSPLDFRRSIEDFHFT